MSTEKKPATNGKEYVDAAKRFYDVTAARCMALPKKWEKALTNPLLETASRIEKDVIMANAVFIETKSDAAKYAASLRERDEYLKEAIRLFDVYSVYLERINRQIDFVSAEKTRLKKIITGIIRDQKPKNGAYEISMKYRMDEIEFTALDDTQHFKLALTQRQYDAWIEAEINAKILISKRLTADREILRRLEDKYHV